MPQNKQWLDWVVELQSLAQAGLTYGKDPYDKERYQRIREIAAGMMGRLSDLPTETVKDLFCNETGYQTPKIDTRAAIFEGEKILLVQEKDGRWSLPGGWCDVNVSVGENTVKEVKEEAGLDVRPQRIIAVQDRNTHNQPPYAYGVCKIFFLCALLGGQFEENIETTGFAYFSEDALPLLAVEKNTEEQIRMCFAAYHGGEQWTTKFD
ncbi:MAG: NUDIX hydrolase [Oscillospiraceae bacterium]|nr:NUDIX hydrolase [Oscillospiraceae bacterium]